MKQGIEQKLLRDAARFGKQAISLWALKKVSYRELGSKVWHTVTDQDVFGRSAQLAYYFFFAIFPGLVFFSSVLGLMGKAGSSAIENLLANLSRLLPPAAFQTLLTAFHETTRASGAGKLIFGAIFALWSATTGMTAIEDTLNAVYRARETRPLWKQYLVAVTLTLVAAVILFISTGVLFYANAAIGFFHITLPLAIIIRIAVWPATFALLALLFAMTYYWAPDVKEGRWQWITPGAVVGIVGWIVASAAFRIYLHFFNTYSATYGSLGAVIILLTWFYVSGLMLLVGAAVNSSIEGMLTPEKRAAAENAAAPPPSAVHTAMPTGT